MISEYIMNSRIIGILEAEKEYTEQKKSRNVKENQPSSCAAQKDKTKEEEDL